MPKIHTRLLTKLTNRNSKLQKTSFSVHHPKIKYTSAYNQSNTSTIRDLWKFTPKVENTIPPSPKKAANSINWQKSKAWKHLPCLVEKTCSSDYSAKPPRQQW